MPKVIVPGSLAHIRQFFEDGGRKFSSLTGFRDELAQLTPEDLKQIKAGLTDGTLTY